MLNRKVTLATPKALDADTTITGGAVDYCYFSEDALTPYMRAGAVSVTIPLDGVAAADKQLAEDFMAMLVRLTGDEISNGTAKAAADAKREAERREPPQK